MHINDSPKIERKSKKDGGGKTAQSELSRSIGCRHSTVLRFGLCLWTSLSKVVQVFIFIISLIIPPQLWLSALWPSMHGWVDVVDIDKQEMMNAKPGVAFVRLLLKHCCTVVLGEYWALHFPRITFQIGSLKVASLPHNSKVGESFWTAEVSVRIQSTQHLPRPSHNSLGFHPAT